MLIYIKLLCDLQEYNITTFFFGHLKHAYLKCFMCQTKNNNSDLLK